MIFASDAFFSRCTSKTPTDVRRIAGGRHASRATFTPLFCAHLCVCVPVCVTFTRARLGALPSGDATLSVDRALLGAQETSTALARRPPIGNFLVWPVRLS